MCRILIRNIELSYSINFVQKNALEVNKIADVKIPLLCCIVSFVYVSTTRDIKLVFETLEITYVMFMAPN